MFVEVNDSKIPRTYVHVPINSYPRLSDTRSLETRKDAHCSAPYTKTPTAPHGLAHSQSSRLTARLAAACAPLRGSETESLAVDRGAHAFVVRGRYVDMLDAGRAARDRCNDAIVANASHAIGHLHTTGWQLVNPNVAVAEDPEKVIVSQWPSLPNFATIRAIITSFM